jgi:gliding motility-associated-like protein
MGISKKQFQTTFGFWAMGLLGLFSILAFTPKESFHFSPNDFKPLKAPNFVDPPIAVEDTFSVDENTFWLFNPTLNDTINGQLTGVTIVKTPKHGTIGFSALDTLIYRPYLGFCGKDTIFYTIANESYAFDTAMIVMTVNCGTFNNNKTPDALDDVFSTAKNARIDLAVIDNDTLNSDVIGPLSIIQFPLHGLVSLFNNTIAYTPQNDFCGGSDTLRYAVCNVTGCDTAMVVINVDCTVENTNANQPIAVDDAVSIKRNAFYVFNPTLNDSIKGTLSGVSIVKSSNNGAIGFVGANTMVYMPQMGFCGHDTVTYRICNALFLCDTASVFITVECTQDSVVLTQLPDALDDEATTQEDKKVTIPVLSNDNPNGMMIAPLSIVRYPSNGNAIIALNDVNYTPNPGFCNGLDTFSYKICNGLGCDTAQVIVRVNCETGIRVADPIAKNDNITTDRNKTVKFKPTLNDTINGTLLAVGFVSAPRHGAIGNTTIDSLVYVPDINYCGYDTLEYRVCRTDLKCDTAFIFITINCTPLGERPNAKNDVVTTLKNKPVTVNILNNDALNGAMNTPLSIFTPAKNGGVSIDASNAIIYTPNADFCGEKDSFTYKICNIDGCDTATVVIDVLCENPLRPIAKDDAAIVLNGKTVEINLTANDTLNGFLDSISIIKYPKNALAVLQNNNVFYTTSPTFCGAFDTLTYAICTAGGCDTAQLVVSVLCDTVKILIPVALNDSIETLQGRLVSINILKNDSLFQAPFESLMVPILPNHGTVSIDSLQNIVYTPNLTFCGGNDTLHYRICTSYGCTLARVVVQVTCDKDVNTPPVAVNDIAYTLRNKNIMIPVLANDSLKGADTVRIMRFAKHGTASIDGSTHQIFYEPNATFCGGADTLMYEICNFKGCATAMVVISVKCDSIAQTPPPIANFDTARVEINKTVLINILKNDTLNKYILLETSVQPKHGILSYRTDGSAYYVPTSEFWGRDSFVYLLCNLTGCDTAKVYIEVREGNKMVVYNGFSPNGDGMNDRLIIRGIENYPNNEVVIYNRWGNEIFKRKGYTNDDGWRGDWNGQIVIDGTYFYAIYYNDEKKQVKTGYIQVHR